MVTLHSIKINQIMMKMMATSDHSPLRRYLNYRSAFRTAFSSVITVTMMSSSLLLLFPRSCSLYVSSWTVQPRTSLRIGGTVVLQGGRRRMIHGSTSIRYNRHLQQAYSSMFQKGLRSTTSASSSSSGTHQQQQQRQMSLSPDDEMFLSQAVEYARYGKGHTFPNPAVGCVIVRQDTNELLGAGFHPRAGYPHAEVFALLEAAGHIDSGVEAAKSVVDRTIDPKVERLTKQYVSKEGPSSLFKGCFDQLRTSTSTPTPNPVTITAYVTLEPCCHYGRTPPCAQSLALAGVDRVVVGYRDPNPRVDGGGVQALRDHGVVVDMADDDDGDDDMSATLPEDGATPQQSKTSKVSKACVDLVENFVKRIIPKDDYDATDYSHMTGAARRALRSYAAKKKTDSSWLQVNWTIKTKASNEDEVNALVLDAEWMERLDDLLWKQEVVNVRLNKAVGKKKLANQLGSRIAKELNAHVAQTVGHTVLLYRPGVPPVLDLEQISSVTQDDDVGP